MESDAEKEEIERGYRNYLPLHHQIREIDATNQKTGKGKGIRVCTKSTRTRQRRGSLEDWRCKAPPASRLPAQAREQGAQCPRPYPLDRRGAPAGLHGNWEEASARPRAAAARPTRPCMVAARIRRPRPRIHRLRQQLGVVPAPSGTSSPGSDLRGAGATSLESWKGAPPVAWVGHEDEGRWGVGASEVRRARGGEEGEVRGRRIWGEAGEGRRRRGGRVWRWRRGYLFDDWCTIGVRSEMDDTKWLGYLGCNKSCVIFVCLTFFFFLFILLHNCKLGHKNNWLIYTN